jgi:hypothetical protein
MFLGSKTQKLRVRGAGYGQMKVFTAHHVINRYVVPAIAVGSLVPETLVYSHAHRLGNVGRVLGSGLGTHR